MNDGSEEKLVQFIESNPISVAQQIARKYHYSKWKLCEASAGIVQ